MYPFSSPMVCLDEYTLKYRFSDLFRLFISSNKLLDALLDIVIRLEFETNLQASLKCGLKKESNVPMKERRCYLVE